jgi:hypothetical protein
MDKVKKLIWVGASLAEAVGVALGKRSIAQVARDRGVSRQNLTSAHQRGTRRQPSARSRGARNAELGGTIWRTGGGCFADAMQRRQLVKDQ